jgi:hypothetical protein
VTQHAGRNPDDSSSARPQHQPGFRPNANIQALKRSGKAADNLAGATKDSARNRAEDAQFLLLLGLLHNMATVDMSRLVAQNIS